jgi:hypothetical protein
MRYFYPKDDPDDDIEGPIWAPDELWDEQTYDPEIDEEILKIVVDHVERTM